MAIHCRFLVAKLFRGLPAPAVEKRVRVEEPVGCLDHRYSEDGMRALRIKLDADDAGLGGTGAQERRAISVADEIQLKSCKDSFQRTNALKLVH
jgi:hypothetical protein